jgi:diadenosine tetraphosphate (Ap4A) HIT family hydrolase
MVHTKIALESHVSDTPDYTDQLIGDLNKALEKAEAAMDKLRDTSKLQVGHRVQATQARPESFAVKGIGIGHRQVVISS